MAALVLGAFSAILVAVSIVVYAGLYNIAADVPHTSTLYWFVETVRDRSIAIRSKNIQVPNNLDDPKRLATGAGQYQEMCAGCHLAPGMKRTEISRGLYPRAPDLRRGSRSTPAEDFWVVKHGVKMTGMPAWGITHNDELLWDVVAFLRKLPDLTPEEYQALVQSVPKTHGETTEQVPSGRSAIHHH